MVMSGHHIHRLSNRSQLSTMTMKKMDRIDLFLVQPVWRTLELRKNRHKNSLSQITTFNLAEAEVIAMIVVGAIKEATATMLRMIEGVEEIEILDEEEVEATTASNMEARRTTHDQAHRTLTTVLLVTSPLHNHNSAKVKTTNSHQDCQLLQASLHCHHHFPKGPLYLDKLQLGHNSHLLHLCHHKGLSYKTSTRILVCNRLCSFSSLYNKIKGQVTQAIHSNRLFHQEEFQD